MGQLKNRPWKGLNAWHIKMIAVYFMTIDHLGAYGFEIPLFGAYENKLRILGRIAMPLFLFILTESLRHTRNRGKFLLRLYLGAVFTGLFVALTNFLFHDSIGRFIQSNIFYQYLFTAIYIILMEEILKGIREHRMMPVLLGIVGMAASWIPHALAVFLTELDISRYVANVETRWFLDEIVCSFLNTPLTEYGIVFVLMGVLMYFAPNKFWKAGVLTAFSFFCYISRFFPELTSMPLFFAVGYPQHYMILAAPVMLMYNGEKGRGNKYFFYAYYPLHRYVISIAVYIYQMLCGG